MAAKKSGMDLGTLLLYGVGAYFVYTNWSSISAWFSNLTAPAAVAPPASPLLAPSSMAPSSLSPGTLVSTTPPAGSQPAAIAPASAGTLVPLAPVATTPPVIPAFAPTSFQQGPGLTVSTPLEPANTLSPPPPISDIRIMRPIAPIVMRGPLVLPTSYGMPHYHV